MQIFSVLSTLDKPDAVCVDLEQQLRTALADSRPDLLILFVTAAFADSFEQIVTPLRAALKPRQFLAVIAESVIGVDREIERAHGVSALAFSSRAVLHTFHLGEDEWQDILSDDDELKLRLGSKERATEVGDADLRAFLFLGDPFTTPIVQLLDACSRLFPRAPVMGGMASGISHAGETRLALNDAIHSSGLIGISFSGNIEVDCVVSQGCRPVGHTFTITRAHQNVIEELDGKVPLGAIEEMVSHLPIHERQLIAMGGLQIGRVIDEAKGNYGRGDFLVRALIGVRRESGAILVGDHVRVGETLQFHVRDARTATEEMRLLLEGETMLAGPPSGALLITCNGRGTRLFEMPDHDVTLARQVLGAIPVAGFFAAGEFGPVGERNFIHGHTAVLAIFREPSEWRERG